MTQNIQLKLDLCHLQITIKANGKNGKMVHKNMKMMYNSIYEKVSRTK